MAGEQPKKPVGGAYGCFLKEKRPEFTKKCQGMKASEISKMGGAEWKKLTAAQKAPYEKQFKEDNAKYQKDMEAFVAAGGVKAKGARALRTEKKKEKEGGGKRKKDANAPKKPAGGAYGVWLAENREAIKKGLPKDHKITDVTKAAAEKWKKLGPAEKKPFEAKYQVKQAEYKAAMEKYKAEGGGAGGDDAEEEEGDGEEEEEEEEEEAKAPPPKKGRK